MSESDYQKLIRTGEVLRRFGDAQKRADWRSEMRAQARADKITIRTLATKDVVFAWLPNFSLSEVLRRHNEDLVRRAFEDRT